MDHPAPYPGVLIRDRGWHALSWATLEYAASHFGSGVSPRGWYLATAGLLQDQEQAIQIRSKERSEQVLGLMGLSPLEAGITGIDSVLSAGTFFTDENEASCLVPGELAQRLGIGPEAVGQAQVQVFGAVAGEGDRDTERKALLDGTSP